MNEKHKDDPVKRAPQEVEAEIFYLAADVRARSPAAAILLRKAAELLAESENEDEQLLRSGS